MDKRTVGEQNKLKALEMIWNFGWLRSQELGLFLWQNSETPKKNAEALVRKLLDQKLVIPRKLPANSGSALFLSALGAEALLELGIVANSGKSIGRIEDGVWIPPKNWKHHLLASGALGHLKREGYSVIAELEIRRKHNLKKFPDGIFYMTEMGIDEDRIDAFWLEVESHRKSGPNMEFMVDSMLKSLKVNILNDSNEICGLTINRLALAFPQKSEDENNHKIDHKQRVTNAFKNKIRQDLPMNFIGLENYGLGVSAIQRKQVTIKANTF